jgi:hypothetical protein
LNILTVRSSLGPSPPNAGRYTVASRFRCRSCERGYIFPRAPEQFVASPLCLVGYVRWDARSDRVPPPQTIIFSSFQVALRFADIIDRWHGGHRSRSGKPYSQRKRTTAMNSLTALFGTALGSQQNCSAALSVSSRIPSTCAWHRQPTSRCRAPACIPLAWTAYWGCLANFFSIFPARYQPGEISNRRI